MTEEFNSGDVPVFCISLKAGGTGLNLTAADIVIILIPGGMWLFRIRRRTEPTE